MSITPVAILVAGYGLAISGRTGTDGDELVATRILAVQTERIQPVTSYQAMRQYTGTIVARRASEIGFELPGKIVRSSTLTS